MKRKFYSATISCMLFLLTISTQSCYNYRVLTTNSDPATEYQKKMVYSYLWGAINNPKDFVVPNCNNNNALDEVRITTNLGYSVLTVVTLGIFSPLEIKWRCHKPPKREGEL